MLSRRSTPVPNHGPSVRAPQPSVMNGMTRNCAIGPIRKAVSGEADCSKVWANPNTRRCRSNGTRAPRGGGVAALGERGVVSEETRHDGCSGGVGAPTWPVAGSTVTGCW